MELVSIALDISRNRLSRIDTVAAEGRARRGDIGLAASARGPVRDPDPDDTGQRLADVQARLREPLREQAEFLEMNSIADEWRTF